MNNVMMGTAAFHKLGDISRDEPDYFAYNDEDAENYYGAWLAGFGFVGVRFPKATSRPMTGAEAAVLADSQFVIA